MEAGGGGVVGSMFLRWQFKSGAVTRVRGRGKGPCVYEFLRLSSPGTFVGIGMYIHQLTNEYTGPMFVNSR
jgi:hypothetical protein